MSAKDWKTLSKCQMIRKALIISAHWEVCTRYSWLLLWQRRKCETTVPLGFFALCCQDVPAWHQLLWDTLVAKSQDQAIDQSNKSHEGSHKSTAPMAHGRVAKQTLWNLSLASSNNFSASSKWLWPCGAALRSKCFLRSSGSASCNSFWLWKKWTDSSKFA